MSSDESVPAISPPSSPLSSTSTNEESQPASPVCSPVKRRKYGRMYQEVRYSEDTCDSPCTSNGRTVPNLDGNTLATCEASSEPSFESLSKGDRSKSSESGSDSSSESGTDTRERSDSSSKSGSECGRGSSDSSCKSGSESDKECSDNSSVCSDGASACSDSDNVCVAQKLFRRSNNTKDEAVLALMDHFIKKRWKISTLSDVLSFCREFFPSNMPKTVYKLFKYVESHSPDDYCEISHLYCSDCLSVKEAKDDKCRNCNSTATGVFFELPLSIQVRHFFEHRNLASLIDSQKSQVCDVNIISDITSSNGYKELKTKANGNYDVTLLFNSDGVSPVHSSGAHLYPILATICEVPPHLRSGFMVVSGIWYDPKFSPIMNTFFNPFVNSLKEIYEKKVVWTHPTTKEKFKSVVVAPILSADAIARADILVMQHHNGKYGCNNCEQKTTRFKPDEGGKKIRRYLFKEKPAHVRDKDRMDEQGRKAARTGKPVKGVLGEAVISEIPHFERGSSAVPEYMHCVLLGVVKQLIKLWFQVPGDWNIKDKMNVIDNKFILDMIKVTDQFTRIPKGIKDLTLWKASDLRAWLLFYALPALHRHLKEKYFQHFMLLVSAIYSLLKQEITEDDIIRAETKIRIFVRDVAKLYRRNDCTYNIHNLLHLAKHVKRWGPLWATSAFPFENFNHILSELAPGPKHKGKQIVKRIKLAQGVEVLRSKVLHSQAASVSKGVLGEPIAIDLELSTFGLPGDTKGYLRANVKGEIFTVKQYDEKVKRGNSIVSFRTDDSVTYGQILYFFERNLEVHCLVRKSKVEQSDIFFHNEGRFSILHLIPVFETETIICTSARSLTKHTKVGNFVCIRPNTIEKNL